MQIHEVTLRQKTDEGILDTAKAAAGAVGQGYNAAKQAVTSNPAVQTATKAYNQVKGGIAGAKAGYQDAQAQRAAGAVGTKAADVWAKYARQLEASLTTPEEKQQFQQKDPNSEAGKLYNTALNAFIKKNLLRGQDSSKFPNGAQIQALAKTMAAQAGGPTPEQWKQMSTMAAVGGGLTQEPKNDLASLLKGANQDAGPDTQYQTTAGTPVKDGYRLKLTMPLGAGQTNPAFYYKSSNGTWTNETGQQVSDPNSVAGLEAKVNAQTAKYEPDPNAIQYSAPQQTRRKGKKK
jgi:hypothetical protein